MLCSLRRGTRTPICSVSSTDRARILAGCLICCSICAGHTRSQTWRSTSLFFASPPSAESALAAVLSPCHAVSCLAVCVLLCRLPYRHLTCTAGIDTTITAILKYTTIPANKGAEGAMSARESATPTSEFCAPVAARLNVNLEQDVDFCPGSSKSQDANLAGMLRVRPNVGYGERISRHLLRSEW